MLKVEKGETMARKANQRATNCLNTVLSPHHKRYITGTLSATPLFLFASGDGNPNLLKISTNKKNIGIVGLTVEWLLSRENNRGLGGKRFRWKIKWRLQHLGALGTLGEEAPLMLTTSILATKKQRKRDITIPSYYHTS